MVIHTRSVHVVFYPARCALRCIALRLVRCVRRAARDFQIDIVTTLVIPATSTIILWFVGTSSLFGFIKQHQQYGREHPCISKGKAAQ